MKRKGRKDIEEGWRCSESTISVGEGGSGKTFRVFFTTSTTAQGLEPTTARTRGTTGCADAASQQGVVAASTMTKEGKDVLESLAGNSSLKSAIRAQVQEAMAAGASPAQIIIVPENQFRDFFFCEKTHTKTKRKPKKTAWAPGDLDFKMVSEIASCLENATVNPKVEVRELPADHHIPSPPTGEKQRGVFVTGEVAISAGEPIGEYVGHVAIHQNGHQETGYPRADYSYSFKVPIENQAIHDRLCGMQVDQQCAVCNSTKCASSMLLCDGCDRGWHTQCMTPKMTSIPSGGWSCPNCAAGGGCLPAACPVTVIFDASRHRNVTAYPNDPRGSGKESNCGFSEVYDSAGVPHVMMIAIREILPGEEVTVDYGSDYWQNQTIQPGCPAKRQKTTKGKGPTKGAVAATNGGDQITLDVDPLEEDTVDIIFNLMGAAAATGGIKAVAWLMGRHTSSANVQEKGCTVLSRLLAKAEHQVVATNGVIEAVVGAMEKHEASAGVQEKGCRALRNLTANAENRAAVAARGGIEAVLWAMGEHRASAGVQAHGCRALRDLSANAQHQVAEKGGVEAVVRAMKAHKSSAGVQAHGCCALRKLAVYDQTRVAETGGVEAVLGAMKAHTSSAGVQTQGCCALLNLTANAQNQAAVAAKGGITAVVRAMERHKASAGVQAHGCVALFSIAWADALLQSQVRSAGALPLVVEAVAAFPDQANLQEWGNLLLEKLGS